MKSEKKPEEQNEKFKLLDLENRLMVARGGAWGWKKWVKGVLNIFKIIIKIKVCSQLKNKTNKTTNKNKQKRHISYHI